ncbi:MAG: class I SAM-dependent methyltransferase [Candidatus Dormibacteraeota bacterium]|nr:class I SAM-dependent methyltransferase [Candidatus Dormibacteraeota bacterium]
MDSDRLPLRERLLSFITRSSALRRVDFVKKLLKPNVNLKVLDIGCGKGSFLYYLQKTVECQVTGIDFDESSGRYCRETLNLEARHGDIHSLQGLVEKYDVVTMWHYLEHEFDPLSALLKANEVLANGELLILEVPNAESLENILFKRRSYLYDVPRHLYSFSPITINSLLEKAGFEVQSLSFPYFAGGWIGTAQSILFQGRIYKELKNNIFLFLLLSQLLFPLEYALSKTSKGSIMTIVARKITNRTKMGDQARCA